MGAKIKMENDIDKLQIQMKEVQGVVAELSEALLQTKQVHHVDLDDELTKHEEKIREENAAIEGVEIEPDEEFTPKRKKAKARKIAPPL